MKLHTHILAVAASLVVFLTAAYADNGGWRVVETSGAVRISQTMAGVQLVSTGETLRGGSILSTGMDGRAVLARGEQTIVVGPNSRMSLPAVEEEGMTRILQDLGTLMFKVDKREKQHFRVETPVIAAVVKGTTFTVTAGTNSHAVHVAEGLVEVTPVNSNNAVLVPGGETVQVSVADHTFMQPESGANDDATPAPTKIEPAEGGKRAGLMMIPADIGVEPLDYANLSDGLVRDDAPVTPGARGSMMRESNSPVFEANNTRQATNANPRAMAAIANAGNNGAGFGNGNAGGNPNNGAGFGNGGVSAGVNVGGGNGNGNGGVGANVNVGGGNGNGNGGVGASVDVGGGNGNGNGGVGASVDVGGGNGNGGVGADVNVGGGNGGGVDVNANVGGGGGGGVDVNANVGGGGVDAGVNVGGGVDAGVDLGNSGDGGAGVDINVGGLGLGLRLGGRGSQQ